MIHLSENWAIAFTNADQDQFYFFHLTCKNNSTKIGPSQRNHRYSRHWYANRRPAELGKLLCVTCKIGCINLDTLKKLTFICAS